MRGYFGKKMYLFLEVDYYFGTNQKRKMEYYGTEEVLFKKF